MKRSVLTRGLTYIGRHAEHGALFAALALLASAAFLNAPTGAATQAKATPKPIDLLPTVRGFVAHFPIGAESGRRGTVILRCEHAQLRSRRNGSLVLLPYRQIVLAGVEAATDATTRIRARHGVLDPIVGLLDLHDVTVSRDGKTRSSPRASWRVGGDAITLERRRGANLRFALQPDKERPR